MPTRTSTQNGEWSSTATWGGSGVSAGDTVNIGHHVTIGPTPVTLAGAGVTINVNNGGLLDVATTISSGSHAITLGANCTINAGGKFYIGTSTSPLPSAVVITFTTGNFAFTCGSSPTAELKWYCTGPTHQYVTIGPQWTDLMIDPTDAAGKRIKSASGSPRAFAAGDQFAYLQITGGTGWTPGYYQFTNTALASGYLTLNTSPAASGATGGSGSVGPPATALNGSSSNATAIEVREDITGDAGWVDGDTVYIGGRSGSVGTQSVSTSVSKVIAAGGRAASSITLSASIGTAFFPGARMYLTRRNIRVTVNNYCFTTILGGHIEAAVDTTIYNSGGLSNCSQTIFSNGSFYSSGLTFNASVAAIGSLCKGCGITNSTLFGVGVFATSQDECYACGCNGVVGYIANDAYKGVSVYNSYLVFVTAGVYSPSCMATKTTVLNSGFSSQGTTFIQYPGYDVTVKDTSLELSGTSKEIDPSSGATQYSLNAYHEFVNYTYNLVNTPYKAWSGALTTTANITTTTANPPTGRTQSYQVALSGNSYYTFFRQRYQVPVGQKINVVCNLKKDYSGTVPALYLVKPENDKFLDSSQTALISAAMTNSTNTWEQVSGSWTNTGALPQDVILYVFATHTAAANFYVDPIVTMSSSVQYFGST